MHASLHAFGIPHLLPSDLPLPYAAAAAAVCTAAFLLCRQDQAFNIVDIKPQSMEDLTEVGGRVGGQGAVVCGGWWAGGWRGGRGGLDRVWAWIGLRDCLLLLLGSTAAAVGPEGQCVRRLRCSLRAAAAGRADAHCAAPRKQEQLEQTHTARCPACCGA